MSAFLQLGGPSRHIGGTLEDYGRIRKDTRVSETGFSLSFCYFRDSLLRVVWALRLEIAISFPPLFVPIIESKFGRLGLLEPGFRMTSIAKNQFSQKLFSMISELFFSVLRRQTCNQQIRDR